MIYVRLTKDEKYVVTVFSSSQENSTEIEQSDARYIDFFNAQPVPVQLMMVKPTEVKKITESI